MAPIFGGEFGEPTASPQHSVMPERSLRECDVLALHLLDSAKDGGCQYKPRHLKTHKQQNHGSQMRIYIYIDMYTSMYTYIYI